MTISKAIRDIALPDSQCSTSKADDPTYLREDRLKDKAKAVYKFVCGKLMPTGHQSEMT